MREAPITLSQLESHLWESANILRGPVDAADFKTYIFPLLFFKRICDVWDEEYDEIVDETGDAELALFPESHRFQIPDDCHWNDVRAVATNVGNALQRAMREIEKANPDTLYGVFGDAQWTNKDRLSDALLKDLHRLGNLTLTGYNSTYSDRPFSEKKTIAGGFDDSPLRLNRFIREQSTWDAKTIEQRGKLLAEKAVTVWCPLVVDLLAVKQRELEEHKALAANYRIENLELDETAKQLLEALRPQIQALGADVVELPNDRSVIYRVFDFFVEIIPRKQRLSLLLNLDFADCEDSSGKARDATEYAFIIGATEAGGVLYNLESQ